MTLVIPVTGRIVMVNAPAKYVVISLAPGLSPDKGTRLFSYRNSQKLGELRIAGPQQDDKVVADIVNGEASIGDKVSDD